MVALLERNSSSLCQNNNNNNNNNPCVIDDYTYRGGEGIIEYIYISLDNFSSF